MGSGDGVIGRLGLTCIHYHVQIAGGNLQCSNKALSPVLGDDLESAVGCGEESKRKWIYTPGQLIHFVVQQKLTQHCKATIPQFYKQNSKKINCEFYTHISSSSCMSGITHRIQEQRNKYDLCPSVSSGRGKHIINSELLSAGPCWLHFHFQGRGQRLGGRASVASQHF